MKRLVVELSDEDHRQIKLRAFESGMTIKQFVKEMIRREFATKKEQSR